MGREQLASQYERLHPGAASDDAQKAERMERLVRRDQAPPPTRRRKPSLVVPALPWKGAA